MIKKFLEAVVKSVDKEKGTFEVVASSGKPDRLGDTIDPKGWYLKNYKKNPVILWSHMAGGFGMPAIPPVARADKIWIEDEKELRIKGHFADTPFAQELRQLVEEGFLNAVSVGFLPLVEEKKGNIEIDEKMYRRATNEETEKGIYGEGENFSKQELLELSWVSIPALPTALVSARKMKLDLVTKALEEMKTEPFDIETYKDSGGSTRRRGKVRCPKCGEVRIVQRIEQVKTGLCSKCSLSQIGKEANRYKDGKWHQSNGYIGILASEVEPEFQCMKDSRGYIYEHRYIMAKKLGRPLEEFEQVHHLNGIKDDNRFENLELVGDGEHLLITKMQAKIKGLEEELEIRPYPGEHSCRLNPPGKYKRFRRENCQRKHDGKCIDVIWGITKGEEEKTEQQAFRYDKKVWTEASAKTHCKDNDGAFEAASEESLEPFEKRLDSFEKNLTKLEEAISVLTENSKVNPKKSTTLAEDKGREQNVRRKAKKSNMERLVIIFDKFCEILLRELRQKSENDKET